MRHAISLGWVFLAAGVMAGTSQVTAFSDEARPAAAQQWEYRILPKEKILELGKKKLAAGLNKLGDEGWELVAIDGDYIFKRPKHRMQKPIEDIKRELSLAEADVEMWKDRVAWSERMVKKGYLTESRVLAERALLKAAEITLDKAKK